MIALQTRIDRARWWALQTQPFYAALAMRLTDTIDHTLPTAATDGRTIRWGQAAATWSDAELRFVLLHETLHCAHQHLWRLPLTSLGNMAGDYVINAILCALGPEIAMPAGSLYNAQYDGLAEEEILAQLESGADYIDACGGWTAAARGPGPTGDRDNLRETWRDAVMQAALAGQSLGGPVPGDIQRIVAAATMRRINWRTALADFIRHAVGTRSDWSRPHRRGAGRGYIVPRQRHDAFGLIVCIRDTSGSVDDMTLSRINAVLVSALADTYVEVVLLDADCRVQREIRLSVGQAIPGLAHGGGGTDFRPALSRAEKIAETELVAGVIYITDLDGIFPEACGLPTVWVSVARGMTAPFGRLIEIED